MIRSVVMRRRAANLRRAAVIRRALIPVAALLATGSLGAPRPAATQILAPIGGALAGAGAGAWISVAYITVQVRKGNYLDSGEEAIGIAAIPLFTGLAAGLALGVFAEDRMNQALLWGGVGWASGIGVGALIGDQVWDDPQGKWAGGVIGGAVGLIVGGVAGLVSSQGDGKDSQQPDGLPLLIRFRF